MALQIFDPEVSLINSPGSAVAEPVSTSLPSTAILPRVETSADVSGIELRMLPPYIKDNRTDKFFPFPGYAKLYCLTIVVSNVSNQLVGGIDLKGFPRIDDKEFLPINKTIFYWQAQNDGEKAPNQIHTMCTVMKSKKALRDTGAILSKLKADTAYGDLLGSLKNAAADAARFNLVTDAISSIASLAGKYLETVEDKPLGTIFNSYTTVYGDFDRLGATPLSYSTRNVDFSFKLVVRSRKEELSSTRPLSSEPGAVIHEDEFKESPINLQPF
jgi:hypothetical protein